MDGKIRMSLDEVRNLTESALVRLGLDERQVAAVAVTIVAGERDGCAAHGLYRLLVCARTVRAGKVTRDAQPVVRDVARALVRVDCGGGFAQIGFEAGAPVLAAKAREYGLAGLGINNCVHFSALWPEVEALARDGLVAFAFTPSHAWVAPAGGTTPIFGTNPIAFGWPRPGGDPFVFDLATSVTARGEIELHRREGQPIPLGWGLDPEGNPTTDAAQALAGAMLTFGGHKGSALAAMVELIAGPLIGDMTSVESLVADGGAGASPIGGELIIAIDPSGFLGSAAAQHLARGEQLFDGIAGQGARLPSERRYRARARSLVEGVEVPARLIAEIEALFDADAD
ncbi:Ldh family oxidoreductase [Sphingosinicella sp. LHD-64]|uniref:Ldh family oxidoreductase n=1 Tax=Sphingosinicella sp. LHD-64 TaxID=3072139 RepID=UPI00280E4B01|nr:Ldh family oxidoreductase [Sphingosinicella sp. LHD-64]MDQ8755493.1 Ldh family oxidoreductase [Sphingosinicella sp. LHD-64]